jgi:biotin carboxyl carrier protein
MMSQVKPTAAAEGTDWTRLLSDPDLVRHVGKLLQTYREAPPEKRESALLTAMREIKAEASKNANPASAAKAQASSDPQPVPTATSAIPPFEPDLFRPNSGDDRRRHPRIKCFVAVEMRVDGVEAPIWGNLCNTSAGGCLVETANQVKSGANVEIGLWVASGKIWVKGFALTGIVTRSAPTTGVRVRFEGLNTAGRDNLRQFLKFVQDSSRASRSENSYLDLLHQ